MRTLKYKVLNFIIIKALNALFVPYDKDNTKAQKETTKRICKNYFTILSLHIEDGIY